MPLAVLVGAVWAASFLAGVVTGDYTSLGITTPVMLVVTGAVMAIQRNGGNGHE